MATALIVVDVQHDFCAGGAMGCPGGIEAARRIAAHVTDSPQSYDAIVMTLDWHIDPGSHWSDTPDFVDSWPVHCKAGTQGAEPRPEIAAVCAAADAVFRKGEYVAAYSGFEGSTEGPDGEPVQLVDWLRARGIDTVEVCGIATDYCVRATALDAKNHGFDTTVLLDLTAGVASESVAATLREFSAGGITTHGSPATND